MLSFQMGLLSQAQEKQTFGESQVKSAYLYNFTKFFYWENDQDVSNAENITIGLMAADEVARLLEDYIASLKETTRVSTQRIDVGKMNFGGCRILYIDASLKNQLPRILAALDGSTILTVSDMAGFAKEGGMIGLFNENGKIRIQMNLAKIKETGLKVSAKLIEVARIIE